MMACKTSYELHHNFPKIADEAGFTFNTRRPRIHIDWNKIRIIDVENLIRERRFVLIEQHLNDILDCVFESEFDVRILDEGVMKMFRLAQLAVEYQQFCRHYLDRSVCVLREEINTLAQDLSVTKKELKERDDEIRKLKRKSRNTYRTPLPYGNDNIANIILKTLENKNDFFPTNSTAESFQHNKCGYCDKIFMNQIYLKSHISRRHANVTEMPERGLDEVFQNTTSTTENNKLKDEVNELKTKLKEMENIIKNVNINSSKPNNTNNVENVNVGLETPTVKKVTRDAEVLVNCDADVLDRIEEWKKGEHEKYNREIIELKNQIIESIQNLKEKKSPTPNNEVKIIEQLNATISKQGSELSALRQELIESRQNIEKDEIKRCRENEEHMMQWVNRTDIYAKQYETLLQKLNEVAIDARESRAQAEKEKERVAQLETLLQKSIMDRNAMEVATQVDTLKKISSRLEKKAPNKTKEDLKSMKSYNKAEVNRESLERLHQKAQDLLHMGSTSSSSSEVSLLENNVISQTKQQKHQEKPHDDSSEVSSIENNISKQKIIKNRKPNDTRDNLVPRKNSFIKLQLQDTNKLSNGLQTAQEKRKTQNHKARYVHSHKAKTKLQTESNSMKQNRNGHAVPKSPEKVLRSKILEEVNKRLTTTGVDPLKSRISKVNFRKQRNQLQQSIEQKCKENSSHEKVRHRILAYLDSNLPKKINMPPLEYVSPNKTQKAFSFTSVLSNVKSKAMSLVKSNDTNVKDKRNTLNTEVAKRVIAMLNTPPDSSPELKNNNTIENKSRSLSNYKEVIGDKITATTQIQEKGKRQPHNDLRQADNSILSESEEESDLDSESDHKYYKAVVQQTTKSIDNLIKSPARRPMSANSNYNGAIRKHGLYEEHLNRSQSDTNILDDRSDTIVSVPAKGNNDVSSSSNSSENMPNKELPTSKDFQLKNQTKQTKGVLKNASSTSSLNKKKVLFDMDAIQMKSVSASPSQSITEKSESNEKYELGLVNLDGEEWDISSIENEPLHKDTKIRVNTKTSPKIAELKQTIESQLARRNETPSTAIVGGIDILTGVTGQTPLRPSSQGGSNTSLGSSILDESENMPPIVNQKAFVKPKPILHKDDSDLDISEFSTDGIIANKNDDTF